MSSASPILGSRVDAPSSSRLRVPWNLRRVGLVAFVGVALSLSIISLRFIKFSLFEIIDGFRTSGYLGRAFPPSFENAGASLEQVGRTFMMAVAGTGLAAILSVPLGLLSARNIAPTPWVGAIARTIIVATRAIPDLVFAVFFVVALSIGELPGILALGIHSIGMLGKLLADSIEQIDPGASEAAMSAGATRSQMIANSIVPQITPSFVSNLLYRLDINTRTSVVLGFVGAGGIGMELRQNLRNPLRYPIGIGQALMVMGLVLIVDRFSNVIRRSLEGMTTFTVDDRETIKAAPSSKGATHEATRLTPPWNRDRVLLSSLGSVLVLGFVTAAWRLGLNPFSFVRAITKSASASRLFFPPDFTSSSAAMRTGFAQTLAIGLAATFLGLLAAIPFSLFVARNTSPNRGFSFVFGILLVFMRAIPELVIVLLFVSAVGLGPLPGAVALSIGVFALASKLFSDRLEGLSHGASEGVAATGASRPQIIASAVAPQMIPTVVGVGMYALDVTIRSSAVLGFVGAGGIGQLLDETIAFLQYKVVAAIIVTLFFVVLSVEIISGIVRKYLI